MTRHWMIAALGLLVSACVSNRNQRVDSTLDTHHRGLVAPTLRSRQLGPLVDAGRFALAATTFAPTLSLDHAVPVSLASTGTGGSLSVGLPGGDLQLTLDSRPGIEANPNGALAPLGRSAFSTATASVGALGGRATFATFGSLSVLGLAEFGVVQAFIERQDLLTTTTTTWTNDSDRESTVDRTTGVTTLHAFALAASGGLALHWQPVSRLVVDASFTAGAQPVLRLAGHAENSCLTPAFSSDTTCDGSLAIAYFDHAASLAGQLAVTIPFGPLGLGARAYSTWVPAAPVLHEPLGAEFLARLDF